MNKIAKEIEVIHGGPFPRVSDADLPIVLKTERRYTGLNATNDLYCLQLRLSGARTRDVCSAFWSQEPRNLPYYIVIGSPLSADVVSTTGPEIITSHGLCEAG